MAEESLLVIFGAGVPGEQPAKIVALVKWGLERGNVRFAFLGDHANSRGAADMGLLPDLLPGYVPVSRAWRIREEYPGLPAAPGKTQPEMFEAARSGALGALLVVGANPVATWASIPPSLKNTFLIVQDLFLTETAALRTWCFPRRASMRSPAR